MDALYPGLRGRPADERVDLRPCLATFTPANGEQATTAGGTLDVLAGPEDPGVVERLSGDDQALRVLLAAARSTYDDVVLDLGNLSTEVPNPAHMLLAARADRVLIVTDSMPESVERTASGQARLQNATHLDTGRCGLVVNRVTDARDLDLDDLSRRCGGLPVVALLPEDGRLIARSRQQGLPWILAGERSGLCRATLALATELTPGLFAVSEVGVLGRTMAAVRRLVGLEERG
jgi:Flp pilus assembly CpaE family ATPase